MKRVSLKAKVPGLCVLGALGATFLLSPLAAFAGCGGGNGANVQVAPPVASIKSVEAFSDCSARPISSTQAEKLDRDGWGLEKTPPPPPALNSAKATVGNGVTTTAPPPPPAAPKPLTPEQIKNIGFLAGSASCSFNKVDAGSKVNLNNGDMFLATLSSGKNSNQPVFGMLVGGKVLLFTSDASGKHFATVLQNPKVKINATVNKPTTPPTTPPGK